MEYVKVNEATGTSSEMKKYLEHKLQYVEKNQEETSIIATKENMELITTFFKANGLIPGVEVSEYRKTLVTIKGDDNVYTEKYYQSICIKYERDDLRTSVLLLNLTAKHHGLNNMLIDYLMKLGVSPITVDVVYTKPVTPKEVDDNFLNNIVPKLKNAHSKTIPVRKSYIGTKE